ncbi:GfV-C20-ORF1 [Ichnoviriform fumiferanae]|uniref:GfV-C20-ORF1 n=1 Tax=Ichnoviriform fumiferanae TaxID=419435 RepID=A2PZY7_9VIRU|nr:GfV-C20-ORF1 [Ichnoviriform fumiferanae]BAF45559.1 GfV-C20-ORF1 [Ichnoviriform fumiferanae]
MYNLKKRIVDRHVKELREKTVSQDKLPNTRRGNCAVSTRQRVANANETRKQLISKLEKAKQTITDLQDERESTQRLCINLQNKNAKLKLKIKKYEEICKQKKKILISNKEKTITINKLKKLNMSQKKEIEELQVKKKEHDMRLQSTRQACKRLFNSRLDRKFAENNSHLITEVHKLYSLNNHLDKIQHCPAMVYMNSVQVPETSESLIDINESNSEPPSKKMKTNENPGNISYNKKSLERLVMDLESRHSEKYDLWRNVLWALNTCGLENGYDTLDIADKFSKRSAKYKNIEDVKKTFQSSDGTMALQYLIDISKIYEEGLHDMEEYLSTIVPPIYLPLTLTQMDLRDRSKLRLTVKCSDASYVLFIIPHLGVLTDHNGIRLNFLTTKIHSSSSTLRSLCAEMSDGFTVTFQEDDYVFRSRRHSLEFILNNPLDGENASITFPNHKRGRKTCDLQRIHKALRKETMKLLSIKSGKIFAKDDNCIVYFNNKNSDATRDDIKLVQALYAAKPNIKTRYCYSGNTISCCDPKTNVWEIIGEKKFDFHLRTYLTEIAEIKLTKAELKHMNTKNAIANIRNIILGGVEITNFANRLNSKLHLFITDNKTIDTSSIPPIIRHIEIEDLAKTTCGWSYNSELAAKYKEPVQSYFNTLFPEQSERDWFLSFIARFLNGRRMDEPFLILTDEHEGKTGKKTLAKLLKAVFGSYYLSNSTIVRAGGTRENNEFAGGLYGFNEKRLLLADGLQKTDTLNCGFIKAITGDCNYYMKHINKFFRTQFEFVVQAGLVVIANEKNMPKFDKTDENFLKKMVVCPLRSRFVTQEEFQEMRRSKNKMTNILIANDSSKLPFHEWRSATLDLLTEYYNKPISTIPDSMKAWKKRVCDMFFDYTDWMNLHLCKSQNENEFVSATEIMIRIKKPEKYMDPREMQRLQIAMKEWAIKNECKYKSRHMHPDDKRKRVETRSVIMNATLDNAVEE